MDVGAGSGAADGEDAEAATAGGAANEASVTEEEAAANPYLALTKLTPGDAASLATKPAPTKSTSALLAVLST